MARLELAAEAHRSVLRDDQHAKPLWRSDVSGVCARDALDHGLSLGKVSSYLHEQQGNTFSQFLLQTNPGHVRLQKARNRIKSIDRLSRL